MTLAERDEQRWANWMQLAQKGDEYCYAKLLTELGDVIAAYLTSRFGPINMIEDCVQESLIAIHAARHTYDSKRLFRPWLFAIVRNRTIDMLRRQRSYSKALEAKSEQVNTLPTNSIDDEVVNSMVFDALAPQYRDVLLLTKVVGLSTTETARKLGLSEGAVRVRVHRGIKATRKILQTEP
ncbi:MAG: sigma-70 family RNA polymerase sigma factor [Methylococcales bacterium]